MKLNRKIIILVTIALIIAVILGVYLYLSTKNKNLVNQEQTFSLEEYQVYLDSAKADNHQEKLEEISNFDEAIKVAEEFFINKYGEEVLEERPWIAKYDEENKAWLIEGTFHCPMFQICLGGVASVIIDEEGNVLTYWHGQ